MTQIAQPAAAARGAVSLGSLLLLVLRVIAGGVLVVAAYFKIKDPLSFSEAIQAFKIVKDDHLVMFGTYVLPWTELFTGIALILGIWTRSAAFIYCSLMVLFIGVIVDALGRGLGGMACGCFGSWHLICTGGLSWCKVLEDSILLAIGVVVLAFGGGSLALDPAIDRRLKPLS